MAATTWLNESPEIPHPGALIAIVIAIVVIVVAVKIFRAVKEKKTPTPPPAPKPTPPTITEREKQRIENEKKEQEKAREKDRKKKRQQAARLFRMAPALGLIIFSIAIGWTNLVDFFVEGASVPTRVAYGSVFVFVTGTLWAGYERYRASGQNQTKTSFTMLLWALIALEGGIQFLHGLLFNSAVEWHGALFLAAMSPLAGVVFELAIAANRSEAKQDEEGESNRQIPGSYKKNPLLYARLLHTKNTNPSWTTPEIVSHVRALDTTRAIRVYNRAMERPERVQKILGTRRHLDRVTRTMIDFNPYGAPPRDGRMTLARQLNLENSAREVAESGGDMYQILTILGVRDDVAREALGLPSPKRTPGVQNDPAGGVQNAPSRGVQNSAAEGVQPTPPEGVQNDPAGGVQLTPDPGVQNSDPMDGVDMDAELAKLLDQHPAPGVQNDPAPGVQGSFNKNGEVFNPHPSKDVQGRGESTRPARKLNTPDEPADPKPDRPRRATRKAAKAARNTKTPATGKNQKSTAEQQVNEVYRMVVAARRDQAADPSTRQIASTLGVSVGTASTRLSQAKEEAEKNGYHAAN